MFIPFCMFLPQNFSDIIPAYPNISQHKNPSQPNCPAKKHYLNLKQPNLSQVFMFIPKIIPTKIQNSTESSNSGLHVPPLKPPCQKIIQKTTCHFCPWLSCSWSSCSWTSSAWPIFSACCCAWVWFSPLRRRRRVPSKPALSRAARQRRSRRSVSSAPSAWRILLRMMQKLGKDGWNHWLLLRFFGGVVNLRTIR